MAIKNFFCSQKLNNTNPQFIATLGLKTLLVLWIAFTLGCQSIQTNRDTISQGAADKKTTSTTTPGKANSKDTSLPDDDTEDTRDNPPLVEDSTKTEQPTPVELVPTPRPIPKTPKIGLIIGPGFLRSFLAVGILEEFHKARVPVQAMVGFEWGSLPAALYSINGQSSEVEWQMMKLTEESVLKKSILRNQIETASISELQPFLNQAFGRSTFEQNRIPFECLTFDIKKKQYFWMKKGDLAKSIPYCLATPPFSKPFLNNVGAVDLKLAADTLRQKGANYIVLINPMSSTKDYLDSSFSTESQVLWAFQQYQLLKTTGTIDFVVDTSSAAFSVLEFGARRDMIRKGQEIGVQAVKKLSTKLGI